MKIVNATPHDLIVHLEDGSSRTFPKGKVSVRVEARTEQIGMLDGMPIFEEVLGEPVLLDPDGETTRADALVVSRVAAGAMIGDYRYKEFKLLVPGEVVRDDAGRIVGCKGFIVVQ